MLKEQDLILAKFLTTKLTNMTLMLPSCNHIIMALMKMKSINLSNAYKNPTCPKCRIALPPVKFLHCHCRRNKTHLDITTGKTCYNYGKLWYVSNICQSKPQQLKLFQFKLSSTWPLLILLMMRMNSDFVGSTTSISQSVTIQNTILPVLMDNGSTPTIISTPTLQQMYPSVEIFRYFPLRKYSPHSSLCKFYYNPSCYKNNSEIYHV